MIDYITIAGKATDPSVGISQHETNTGWVPTLSKIFMGAFPNERCSLLAQNTTRLLVVTPQF